MIGYPAGWDDIQLRGNLEAGTFTTVYLKEGIIRAALMVNDDAEFNNWSKVVAAQTPIERVEQTSGLALA